MSLSSSRSCTFSTAKRRSTISTATSFRQRLLCLADEYAILEQAYQELLQERSSVVITDVPVEPVPGHQDEELPSEAPAASIGISANQVLCRVEKIQRYQDVAEVAVGSRSLEMGLLGEHFVDNLSTMGVQDSGSIIVVPHSPVRSPYTTGGRVSGRKQISSSGQSSTSSADDFEEGRLENATRRGQSFSPSPTRKSTKGLRSTLSKGRFPHLRVNCSHDLPRIGFTSSLGSGDERASLPPLSPTCRAPTPMKPVIPIGTNSRPSARVSSGLIDGNLELDLYGDEDTDRGGVSSRRHHDMWQTNSEDLRRRRNNQCILSPVGKVRLSWDLVACTCLLVELWLIPLELVFTSNSPGSFWEVMGLAVTGCFMVDILMNFNTGYILKDKIIMKRTQVMWYYLRGWFWLDIIATIPYDLVVRSMRVNIFASVRLARTIKILKTLRVLRMLRAIKFVQSLNSFDFILWSRHIFGLIPLLFAILLVAHFNACIKAAVDNVETSEDEMKVLREYYSKFTWALAAMVTDSSLSSSEGGPGDWTLTIFLCIQRLLIIVAMCLFAVNTGRGLFQEEAELSLVRKDALRYFRHHGVSVEMQLQVLYCLHETSRAQTMRSRFRQLMLYHLPSELKRAISEELWTARLMSLGLILRIHQWHDDLITELAQIVQEEILASKTVLCKEGNASIAAYHIVKGRMIVRSSKRGTLPDFSENMWVGEQALVNPALRRNYTAIAKTLSHIMAVPGEAFQNLLERLNLLQRYQDMCMQQLTGGLCGRCGALGDHHTHRCPLVLKETRGPQRARSRLMSMQLWWRRSLWPHLRVSLPGSGTFENGDRNNSDPHIGSEYLGDISSSPGWGREEHMLFLSHYKDEAGTEAALMRTELFQLLQEDPNSVFHNFEVPLFLDTEDLTDLEVLQEHVMMSHNLALLLSKNVLTRPWVIVEVVTAVKNGVRVIPIKLEKQHEVFDFPTDEFYTSVAKGTFLPDGGMDLLRQCDIEPEDVEEALRTVFKRIAIPFSPHRKQKIRHAELHALIVQCRLRDQEMEIMSDCADY